MPIRVPLALSSPRTPTADALQQERQTQQVNDQYAQDQDFIAKQQREQAKIQQAQAAAAADAARAQKAAITNAKRAGVQTRVDPNSGQEDIQRHEDGQPVYQAGFIGTPQVSEKGGAAKYRDARGRAYEVPFDAIRTEQDPAGETFYSFDVTGEDGSKQTMRQPAGTKPLFRVDPTTGNRLADMTDPATGSVRTQVVGIDRPTASKAAIAKRRDALQLRQNEISRQAEELRLQRELKDTLFTPVKERFNLAQDAHEKINKAKIRYEQRPDTDGKLSLHKVTFKADGEEDYAMPVSNLPQEIASAQAWIDQKKRADADFAAAKAEHDPAKAELQTMDEQRARLAINILDEKRRAEKEIRLLDEAAKKNYPVYEPEWQKRFQSILADPRVQDIATIADLENAGDPMAADVQKATIGATAKRFTELWNAGFTGPQDMTGKVPLQPGMIPSEATREQVGETQKRVQLVDGLASGLTAGKPATVADSKAARDIAAKSLGMQPDGVEVSEQKPEGHYELTRNGEMFATLDPRNNRLTLLDTPASLQDKGAEIIANASPDGVPVYMVSSEQPFRPAEVRDLIQTGINAARNTKTELEAEQALADVGLDSAGIRQKVMAGKLSVQDGKMLNEKLNNVQQVNTTAPAVKAEFGKFLTETPIMAEKYRNGTREQKAEVVNLYMDGFAAKAGNGVVVDRSLLAQRRAELLAATDDRGAISKAAGFTGGAIKSGIASLAGIGYWMLRAPDRSVRLIGGTDDEGTNLVWNQSRDLVQRLTGENAPWNKDSGPMGATLGEVEAWASRADTVDDMPDELAEKLAEQAFTNYHGFSAESAADVETSRDTFNVKKNPQLRPMLENYLKTGNGAAFQSMYEMLKSNARERVTAAEVQKYIERPRVATPAAIASRASLLGIQLDPTKATAALNLSKQLEEAKDEKQQQVLLKQAATMFGLENPDHAALALSEISREETTDPESWTGMFRGASVAGIEEAATEVVSDVALAALSATVVGAPEAVALKGAQVAAKQGIRGALSKSFQRLVTHNLDNLANRSAKFAKIREVIGKGRAALGNDLRQMGEDFQALGIRQPKFGQALTTGQKAANLAVATAKATVAGAPIEALEEGLTAVLSNDPSAAAIGDAMLQGAIGVGGITPVFAGVQGIRNAFTARGQAAKWEAYKAGKIAEVNEFMARIPGFKPLTAADFDAWQGLQESPEHRAATAEWLTAKQAFDAQVEAFEQASQAGPAVPPPSLLAAKVALETAHQNLAGLSQVAFEAMDEIRALAENERVLYTAAAKAAAGATDYTEAEAKALMQQSGANAVIFQQAQTLPANVQGPAQLKNLADLPNVTTAAPGVYRLPDGVRLNLPQPLVDMLAQKSPSMVQLMGRGAAPATAQGATPEAETKSTKGKKSPPKANEPNNQTPVQPQQGGGQVMPQPGNVPVVPQQPPAQTPPPPDAAGVAPTPTGKALPAKQLEKITREDIGRIVSKSPKVKALVKETKKAHRYPTGGMWMNPDGTIAVHIPTIIQQLAAQGITDPATAGRRVQALLDEEIRHSANMEAARRLFASEKAAGRVLRGMAFESWRDAWYGDIWNNHFTDAMRQAVQDAYGDTLPSADWMRAMEGLRMLDQLRSTGSITEAVLQALEAVIETLRDFLDLVTAGGKQVIEDEIKAMQAVLAEYGYENGTVKPDAKKKPAKADSAKKPQESAEKEVKTPKSSTQFTLSPADAKPILDFGASIPKDELSPAVIAEDGTALETEPHVTVLYGLTKHEAAPVAKAIKDHGPVTVTLGKLSIFENGEYDVLKVDVEGPGLRALNAKLTKLPHESSFPDYKPHMTIAYLKKGEGKKYVGDTRFEGQTITFDTMTFSPPSELRGKLGKPELPLTPSQAIQPATTQATNEEKQTEAQGQRQEVLAPSPEAAPESEQSNSDMSTGAVDGVAEPPHIWKGVRNGQPAYILRRTPAGQYEVQIGKDQTIMPEGNAARMAGLKKKQIQALPANPAPQKAASRPDLTNPPVQVGDWISDSRGSRGPVISFDGQTPVMGMEGENEGDVDPQTAVGGWKLEKSPFGGPKPASDAVNTTTPAFRIHLKKDGERIIEMLSSDGVTWEKQLTMRDQDAAWAKEWAESRNGTLLPPVVAKGAPKIDESLLRPTANAQTPVQEPVSQPAKISPEAKSDAGDQALADAFNGLFSSPVRVTPAQDAAYMAAVEAGDMETAQRMVDAAKKKAVAPFKIETKKDPITSAFDTYITVGSKTVAVFRDPENGLWYYPDKGGLGNPIATNKTAAIQAAVERIEEEQGGALPSTEVQFRDWRRDMTITLPGYYLRFGDLPKGDKSAIGNQPGLTEKGVSVLKAWKSPEGVFVISSATAETGASDMVAGMENRPIYIAYGRDTGEVGSDGEPLLENVVLTEQVMNNRVVVDDPSYIDQPITNNTADFKDWETIEPSPDPFSAAAPITRDDAGNVIPLSQRFNPDSDSILYSAPARLTQADLPKERRDAMMKAASVLVDVGVKTPLELAQRLEKLAPNGALRQYSRAFWRLMTGFDSTLEESPDWQAVYAELDQVSARPPSVEGAVPEQGAAPAMPNYLQGFDQNQLNTPLMQQWRALRDPLADNPNTILLVRLGDFYEAFGGDAAELARILEIALTKRNGVPMSGIPHHSAEGYIQKLVRAGKRVAVAEMMEGETQAVKGKREIVRVEPAPVAEDSSEAVKSGPPSLGTTGKEIWQGWKKLTGAEVMPDEVVVGVDVHNGGVFMWSGDELMRSETNAKAGTALMRPATKAEIEDIHDSIDRGGLQIEARKKTGATGMYPKVDGGKTAQVYHQATGKPLAEWLETDAGKKWLERDKETQRKVAEIQARADTPATAEAKVEEQVQTVAATEGQRDAKEIKKEIAANIEQAIKDLQTGQRQAETITFQIPGDGTFKVLNQLISLQAVLKRVKRINTADNDAPEMVKEQKREATDYALEWGTEASFNTALDQLREFIADHVDELQKDANAVIPASRLERYQGQISRYNASQKANPKYRPSLAAAVKAWQSTQGAKMPTWAELRDWLGYRARQAGQSAGIEWTPEATPAPESTEMAGPAAPAVEETAPTQAATRKPRGSKKPKFSELLTAYFTPGKVVKSYGGFDRVISLNVTDQSDWSVKVRSVQQVGGRPLNPTTATQEQIDALQWEDSPGSVDRSHGTVPSQKDLNDAWENRPAVEESASQSTTEDAGAELTYNRRNRIRGGIKWQDIKDKTPTLRISETKKANVYPKPDYEQLVADGMPVIIAHVVKQVYDSIAIAPALSRTPTDADLQTYIDTVNKIMDGVMAWTANPEAVKEWVDSTLKQAGAMISRGPINITDMVARPKVTLLEIAFPNWKDNREALRMAGGNKVLGALQPGTEEAQKAVKDIGAGWPAKQEAWSKQGYRIVNRDELKLRESNKTVVEVGGYMLQYFDTTQQAQEFIADLKPFLVIDKVRRIKGQADTQEAAAELAREIVKRAKKEPQIDPKGMSVQDAEREGESRRMEGEDITSERLRETFGFKGINFGNWMKGDSNRVERQLHLNHAYDAFMDMADILGVPPKAMSLNGLLGIAFGAQGSGGFAAAHFVPGVNEINLTRTNGAGSLAHEWAHGLDHYFAVKGGIIRDSKDNRAFLSEHVSSIDPDGTTTRIVDGKSQKGPAFPGVRPEVVAKFRDIVRSMRKRRETPEETAAKVKAADERTAKNIESWIKSIKSDFMREKVDEAAFDALAERIRKGELGDGMVAASRSSLLYPVIAEMRDLYKAKTGRVYSLSQSEGLNSNVRSREYGRNAENAAKRHEPQNVNTDYYRAAIKMDKDKGGRAYWATDLEMFARAFDAYVSDTLEAKAAKNTYLSHAGRDDETTPANQERETIKNAFQALIETLETEETEQGIALYSAPAPTMPRDRAEAIVRNLTPKEQAGKLNPRERESINEARMSLASAPARQSQMLEQAAATLRGEGPPLAPGLQSMFNPRSRRPETGERGLFDRPKDQLADSIAKAYRAVQMGQSTVMVPIRAVFQRLKAASPALTVEDYLAAIQAADERGDVMLESANTTAEQQANAPFVVPSQSGPGVRMAWVDNRPPQVLASAPSNSPQTPTQQAIYEIRQQLKSADAGRSEYPVPEERLNQQAQSILEWAVRNNRTIQPQAFADRATSYDELGGGEEHDVWYDASRGRVLKLTKPGAYGIQQDLTRYLDTIEYSNRVFGDDIAIEGVMPIKGWPHILISQPFYRGEMLSQPEIDSFFAGMGAKSTGRTASYFMPDGARVYDAKPRNVLKLTDGTTQPIDVQVALASAPARSVTAAQDAAYAKAVADGDMETAQRMVDEAARAAGYNVKAFHETNADFNTFDPEKIGTVTDAGHLGRGFYFTTDSRKGTKKNIMEVFLKAANPANLSMPDFRTDKRTLMPSDITVNDSVILDYSPTGYAEKEIMVKSPSQIKSADPVTRDADGNVIPLSQRFNPQSDSILYSAPAKETAKQEKTREILESMPPPWRDVLQDHWKGQTIEQIAEARGMSLASVGFALRMGQGRFQVLMNKAAAKPVVQVEDGVVKAKGGRPDLAMSGNAIMAAVDQQRMTPEEVTHAEMQELAVRMFDEAPEDAETLVRRYLDSNGTDMRTEGMSPALQAIVADAQARNSVLALMMAAGQLYTSRKTMSGNGSTLELVRLGWAWRDVGTETARALSQRQDPFDSPEERAAYYLQDALLTPPESIRNELRRNPANKERILAAWAARADQIKQEMLAEGIDLDVTFREFAKEQQMAEDTIPEPAKPVLRRAPKRTRQLVKAIAEGLTLEEALSASGMTPEQANKAYAAFRAEINAAANAAASQAKDELLRSAPAPVDYAANMGLPAIDFTTADLKKSAVENEKTRKLKEQRERKKAAAEIDLRNRKSRRKALDAISTRKANAFDKLSEFWRASILSGPQTHVVNLVSGLTFGAYEATFKKLATGAQADIARMFGLKPDAASLADVPAMISAVLPSIKEAFLAGIGEWQTQSNVFDAYAMNLKDADGQSFKESYAPALKGILGKIMRGISFRAMGAADAFVKSFFTRIEVVAQARRIARNENLTGEALRLRIAELTNQRGSVAWERALAQAKRITFQNEEVRTANGTIQLESPLTAGSRAIDTIDGFAKLISRAKKGDFGKLLKGLSHFTFPFVDTPTNIFKMGVTMSPVGGLLAIIDATRSLMRRQKGNAEEAAKIYNAARALDDLTNQLVAWGFILGLSELVKPGDDDEELPWITGTIPWRSTSPGEREIAYRTAPPQSIRIGGQWVSYKRLDPFASSLAFTVDAIKEFQSGQPIDEVWTKIGLGMMRNMQDKTFLQGVSDVVNTVQDPERFGTKWATNIAIGFIPNLIRQPIRTADPLFRESDQPNDMGFWDSLGRRVGYGIYPQAAAPAVDIWGREVSKNTGTGGPNTDWMLRLFSPLDMKDADNVDPLDRALLRYNMTHSDEPFGVTAPSREITRTIGGQQIKVSLDDAEYTDFTTKAGKAARSALGDRYNRDLTEQDVEDIKGIIQKVQGAYRNAAFVAAVQKHGGVNSILANTRK